MIGKTISHYKIIEKLGEGGMGVVYKAHDTKLDRLVALKFLPAHLSKTDDDKARFLREAKAAAALNHNNVCTIHEINDDEENPFIVMEYVEGKTLKVIIQDCQKDSIPLSTVIDYTAQIGEALKTAHAKGIVHRDIKAENIMITETGVIKVMDFGLAKLSDSAQLTKDTSTLGTVAYMSPEQIEGKEVDARADIFSFAVVLYEMLSCRMPFRGEYDSATMYAIINEEPEPIQKHRSDLSSEMLHVLNRALEKNPEERYQSVNDMLIDLKRIIKELGSDKTESPKTVWLTEKKPMWKKPLPVMTSVLAVIALIIGIVWLTSEDDSIYRDKWIAVLPFDPITRALEDTIFCDGFHDALITQLQKIGDLHPLSRSTMMTYRNSGKRPTEIATELGVKHLIAASVQRIGNRLSIDVQLIDGTNEDHVWAERYVRDYTTAEIIDIQQQIAQSIAHECKIKVTPEEQNAMALIPTDNLEAYELYQKAKLYYDTRSTSYRKIAAVDLEKAVSLDSSFVLAYTLLTKIYLQLFLDIGEYEYAEKAEAALARAEEINPDLPEVLVEKCAVLCYIRGDCNNALELINKALSGAPNNSNVYREKAYTLLRLGKFDEAIYNFTRSYELDPNSVWTIYWLSNMYQLKKKWIEADKWADILISKYPELHWGYRLKADIYLKGYGQIEKAHGILEKGWNFANNSDEYINSKILVEVHSREYETALKIIEEKREHIDYPWYKVLTLSQMGRDAEAGILCDSLITVYEQRLIDTPDSYNTHRKLGWCYAQLGRREDAIREGLKAVELALTWGFGSNFNLIMIYIKTGEYDKAIEMIDAQLKEPYSIVTHWRLRLDPRFDPLRKDTRFIELIK